MAVYKCKMCGGSLEITEGTSVCTCDYCGATQTLPKIVDENLQGLFNRANVLRMKAEFDKASEIYEKILQSNGTEAEAYWGLILCKYGIEYVEDPTTFKRVPTCHRASFDAVTADDDYKMAIQYADATQKAVYEEEAKQIDEIQKGIVALAQKADPYDVFICYKETDESGKRTVDSVIANDIYHQLTQEGYKVFYAAITLEDKLGQEYEPYIFSALNTSRVMLAIGTKPEYFQAVWVKNEWSRFLKIMKKDRARMLIPCYKDMDAYELPEEFAHLQAQDMSKIGFINDIVRGIKKVVVKESAHASQVAIAVPQAVQTAASGNTNALIKRGNMALEDGEWKKADEFFEEVLNQDAECAEAYLGKLMSKHNCNNMTSLAQYYISKYESSESERLEACPVAQDYIDEIVSKYTVLGYLSASEIKSMFDFDITYVSELSFRNEQKKHELSELSSEKLLLRAQQYAVGDTKNSIDKMVEDITGVLDERISTAQKSDNDAIASIKSSYESHLNEVDIKVIEVYNKSLENRELDYNRSVDKMNQAKTISDYEIAKNLFAKIPGYRDTLHLQVKCQKEIERLKEEERHEREKEEARKEEAIREEAERLAKARKKKKRVVVSLIIVPIVLVVVMMIFAEQKKYNYKKASTGDYVYFGKYNDKALEWRVLAKEDNKLLLITKYGVEYKQFDFQDCEAWGNSYLRYWLNHEFLNKAFSAYEENLIVLTDVITNKNPKYDTDPGNATQDKVFLLSVDEVDKYFDSDNDRILEHETKKGALTTWWLRTPGKKGDVTCVGASGKVDYMGWIASYESYVRPAIWIDISDK